VRLSMPMLCSCPASLKHLLENITRLSRIL
jgi:hypothetical protein